MKKKIIKEFLKYYMLSKPSPSLGKIAQGLSIALRVIGTPPEDIAWLEQRADLWMAENCPGNGQECILGCEKCLDWIEEGSYGI